ncbi:hypothetical protein chiPu_0028979, partial [Chiloscyllium punctatum]|nr:hypothetical protein [Chiloscyllium punctatum]
MRADGPGRRRGGSAPWEPLPTRARGLPRPRSLQRRPGLRSIPEPRLPALRDLGLAALRDLGLAALRDLGIGNLRHFGLHPVGVFERQGEGEHHVTPGGTRILFCFRFSIESFGTTERRSHSGQNRRPRECLLG